MSIVNDRIEFRFVTRTQTEDYRVIGIEDGIREPVVQESEENRWPDAQEFEPLRKMGDIIPEDGPCAVLFEYEKKIYLVVSSMRRGEKDKAGRTKRFSFCQIFPGAERVKAYRAFTRIAADLSEAETKASELIKEVAVTRKDWQGRDVTGENIEFRQRDFIDWLQEERQKDISFKRGSAERTYRVGEVIWPESGCRLKWMEESSPDTMTCERIETLKAQSRQKRTGLKLAFAAAVLVLILGGAWGVHQYRKAQEEAARKRTIYAQITAFFDEAVSTIGQGIQVGVQSVYRTADQYIIGPVKSLSQSLTSSDGGK